MIWKSYNAISITFTENHFNVHLHGPKRATMFHSIGERYVYASFFAMKSVNRSWDSIVNASRIESTVRCANNTHTRIHSRITQSQPSPRHYGTERSYASRFAQLRLLLISFSVSSKLHRIRPLPSVKLLGNRES